MVLTTTTMAIIKLKRVFDNTLMNHQHVNEDIVQIAQQLIGHPTQPARDFALKNGYIMRVVRINGKPLISHQDMRDDRINVETENFASCDYVVRKIVGYY